jgi:glycosyltransferase involved in cell wall biosynthesis
MAKKYCSLLKIPEDKIHHSRLGVNSIYLLWDDPTIQEKPNTVLCFGRISKYKGLEYLAEASNYVYKENPGVRFIIAGQETQKGSTDKYLERALNQQSFEVIKGYISNDKSAQLFRRATLVTLPYTDATQSGVLMTAFAFGKPVVASNVDGLGEYVTHEKTGLLVPPRDPKKLADAIIKLLSDNNLRDYMKKNIATECATRFSYRKIAAETVNLYKKCLNSDLQKQPEGTACQVK